MEQTPPKTLKQPTVLQGLIGSAIPLLFVLAIASIGGFLLYIFWFGVDWLFH